MNILICSKLFYPNNAIGAVRVTIFAKFLHEKGHNVTVLTGASNHFAASDIEQSLQIVRVNNSNGALKLMSRVERSINSPQTATYNKEQKIRKSERFGKTLSSLRSLRLQIYTLLLEYDWYAQAKKIINDKMRETHFDIVISSYGPLSSYLAARYIVKQKQASYWISDLRDQMENEEYPQIINRVYKHYENDMIKKVNAITVVSIGQREMLRKLVGETSFLTQQVHVVYNCFEKELPRFTKESASFLYKRSKKLNIVYSGSLYNGKGDMSMLFKALHELLVEQKVLLTNFQIHYAGKNSAELYDQASGFQLAESIVDHGYLSRAESIRLQESADILVVLAWNTKKEQGILSGKFFEYIQSFKPIISIVSGDVRLAELTEMVENFKLGIGCEQISEDVDLPRLKDFLYVRYQCVMNGSEIDFNPDIEQISQFHCKNIGIKVEKICFDLLSESWPPTMLKNKI